MSANRKIKILTIEVKKLALKKASDHISLCCDSTMSNALNFYFLSTLLQLKKKKDYIRRKLNIKRKRITCEISIIIIILIWQKLESVGPVEQKIKLPSPNTFSIKLQA